jgi:hypothetical protein
MTRFEEQVVRLRLLATYSPVSAARWPMNQKSLGQIKQNISEPNAWYLALVQVVADLGESMAEDG